MGKLANLEQTSFFNFATRNALVARTSIKLMSNKCSFGEHTQTSS